MSTDGEEKTDVVVFNEGAAGGVESPADSPVDRQLDVAQEVDARKDSPEPVTSRSPDPLLPKEASITMDENGATVVVNFTEKEKIHDDVEVGVQINGGKGKEEEAYKEAVQERSVGLLLFFIIHTSFLI